MSDYDRPIAECTGHWVLVPSGYVVGHYGGSDYTCPVHRPATETNIKE